MAVMFFICVNAGFLMVFLGWVFLMVLWWCFMCFFEYVFYAGCLDGFLMGLMPNKVVFFYAGFLMCRIMVVINWMMVRFLMVILAIMMGRQFMVGGQMSED